MIERRTFLGTLAGGLLAAPLAAEAEPTGKMPHVDACRGTLLEFMACRVSIVVMGLVPTGCVIQVTEPDRQSPVSVWAVLLVAGVVFLVSTGILMLVSTPRRSRKLAKILLALIAGSACGALWILLVGTVVTPAKPDAMNDPAMLVVGVVTALAAASLLAKPKRLSTVVGLSAMAIGFHCLALPIAALIAFLVGGAQWFPAASVRPALTAVILRIRLAGDLPTVGLSVGGLLSGLVLVFVGERVLRHRRMRSPRARFDLSRPHG